MKITSRDNSLLRHARAVRDGKTDETIFVEGLRLSEEALRSGLKIDALIYSEQIAKKPRAAQLIRDLEKVAEKSASVSEKLLESISYTKTPQGIVLLAERPNLSETEFTARQTATSLLVVMHQINNPVNVGAILRAAEAAGATGVITTSGTADPFSPKSLRGAMGSAFRLPTWTNTELEKTVARCRTSGVQIICADVRAATSYTDVDWSKPSALVLGPESAGLSQDEIALADLSVRIPMKGATESLNVALAA